MHHSGICPRPDAIGSHPPRGRTEDRGALAIFNQVCEALFYVHSRGIVHRDLKSNNIKVEPNGQAKLLDFGISLGAAAQRVTRTRFVVGTPDCLSPEQVAGRDADFRSDIWALGIPLYEMTTGGMPFEGANLPDLYTHVLKSRPSAPSILNPSVPRSVERVILRALEKRAEDRYQSVPDLISDLRRISTNNAPAGVGRHAFERWVELLRRNPRAAFAAGAVTAAVALLAGSLVFGPRPTVGTSIPAAVPTAGSGRFQGAPLRVVQIDAVNGPAEVFVNGAKLGETPYMVRGHIGETIQLELRRPGYLATPVQFEVTERSAYSFTLQREGQPGEPR